jgi:hypothetical protein
LGRGRNFQFHVSFPPRETAAQKIIKDSCSSEDPVRSFVFLLNGLRAVSFQGISKLMKFNYQFDEISDELSSAYTCIGLVYFTTVLTGTSFF